MLQSLDDPKQRIVEMPQKMMRPTQKIEERTVVSTFGIEEDVTSTGLEESGTRKLPGKTKNSWIVIWLQSINYFYYFPGVLPFKFVWDPRQGHLILTENKFQKV